MPARRSPAIAAFACTLLVLLLPALVAAASIGARATPGELARVERALSPRAPVDRVDSAASRLLHAAAVVGTPWPTDLPGQEAVVVRARLAQVLGVGAIALLTYLAVLLARGRLQALLACALVAALPPVATAGHVLRPETAAATFAVLSIVLFESASRPAPRFRHQRPRRSGLTTAGLMLCAALAAGLACEALPTLGEILLVPAAVLVVGACQLGGRAWRSLSRRGLFGTPIRALNRRLLPWTAAALLAPACAVLMLRTTLTVPVERIARTEATSALLPADGVGQALALGLAALGLVAGVARVGLRLGRRGRLGPDLILFVYCAVFLLSNAVVDDEDALPALPAMAALLSEGLRVLLVLLLTLRRRRADFSSGVS